MRNSQCMEGYREYLKGKYFGILNDYEKNKDFDKLLDSLLRDLIGAQEQYDSIHLVNLFAKTASLRYLKYKYFRSTIMECMKLVEVVFQE